MEIELPEDMAQSMPERSEERAPQISHNRGNYRAMMSRQSRRHREPGRFAGYALTAVVAAVVVAFGISIINGRERVYSKVNADSVEAVNSMEDAINLMRTTETETEETNQTDQTSATETIIIPVENVEGDISEN